MCPSRASSEKCRGLPFCPLHLDFDDFEKQMQVKADFLGGDLLKIYFARCKWFPKSLGIISHETPTGPTQSLQAPEFGKNSLSGDQAGESSAGLSISRFRQKLSPAPRVAVPGNPAFKLVDSSWRSFPRTW